MKERRNSRNVEGKEFVSDEYARNRNGNDSTCLILNSFARRRRRFGKFAFLRISINDIVKRGTFFFFFSQNVERRTLLRDKVFD